MDYKSFIHSTPKVLNAYHEAHELKLKEEDLLNWYLGQYFADALLCTIGNSGFFKKQGAKPHEYPKQPYTTTIAEQKHLENLSEEEKIEKTKQLFAKLQVMATNDKLSKESKAE